LLLALVLLAAVPLAAALYVLPTATITLRPASQPAQAIVELTADPTLAADPVPKRFRCGRWRSAWPGKRPGQHQRRRPATVRALALQALNAGAADRLASAAGPRRATRARRNAGDSSR
jgi:hypothetical protein